MQDYPIMKRVIGSCYWLMGFALNVSRLKAHGMTDCKCVSSVVLASARRTLPRWFYTVCITCLMSQFKPHAI